MFIPRRAGMRRPPIGRAEMALHVAHQLLSTGHPEEAARIFNTLADGMDMRGMKIRAAMIRMQAAYVEALSNMSLQAVRSAGMALDILAVANQPMKTAASTGRVINVLRQKGHEKEAAELEAKVDALLEKAGSSRQQVMQQLAAARGQHHGELPAKCPSCGGPLLPDEVEWHDASTASCIYCGSAVKAS